MKKTIPILLLVAALCLNLAGCITIGTAGPEASAAQNPAQASAAPEASGQPDLAVSPQAGDNAPGEGAAAPAEGGQGAVPDGLTAHYPWERVPLPEGSEFIKVESIEDTDKYVEYTYVFLPMTKTEAVAYFEPLLQKDADFSALDDNLEYLPLEITGAYPDAKYLTSLYSRYTTEAEPNIYIITINLYTSADGENVLVAVIQVNYQTKP